MSSINIFEFPENAADTSFGFLSVVELPQLGFCGGLLVVSSIGRPVEFHCTAPVKPNRTQQIMYGQTYRSFLYSDQIATALIQKLKAQPTIFVSDSHLLLPLAESLDAPLVLLENESFEGWSEAEELHEFEVIEQRCWSPKYPRETSTVLEKRLHAFAGKLPLDEPIERIAQAIEEAHAVLRAG